MADSRERSRSRGERVATETAPSPDIAVESPERSPSGSPPWSPSTVESAILEHEILQSPRASMSDSETISSSESDSDTSSSGLTQFPEEAAYEPDNNMKATRSIQRKAGLFFWCKLDCVFPDVLVGSQLEPTT